MSSVEQGLKTKQELLEDYEKDYLARLQKQEKEPDNLQNVILQMTEKIKDLEKKDYIGFCEFCNMGVSRDEMTYKNNRLFHRNCFEQQGSKFPSVNQELVNQNSNAKVELILLKNLKARMTGSTNKNTSKARPKTKKKSKRTVKKRRPKKRTKRRTRFVMKKRKTKRKTARKRVLKKRRISRKKVKKRRTAPKRRSTKRNRTRRTKRRTSRRKTSRRGARRSSKRRIRRR